MNLKNVFRPSAARLGGIGVMLLALAAPLGGSVVVELSLPELIAASDSVVQGRVESVYSEWDAARRLIFTYTAVRVDDPLKGPRRRSVLIRQMGGRIGAVQLAVAGMPEFEHGSEVIVFLKDAGNGTFHVVGLEQGRYRVAGAVAVANVSGIDLADSRTGRITDAARERRENLEDFKRRIRELVR